MGQLATKLSPEDEKKRDEILRKHQVNIEEKLKKLEALKNKEVLDVDNQKLRIFYEEISEAVLEINKDLGTGLQLRPPKDLEEKFEKYKEDVPALVRHTIGGMEFVGKGALDTVLLMLGVPAGGALAKKGLFPRVVSDNVFIPLITSATVLALAAFRKI